MDWISISGGIAAVATAVVTVQKVLKNLKKAHELHNAKILQAAKEDLSVAKIKLEARIEALEHSLVALKEGVSRDIAHVKETHSNELKNLGEKIGEIRQELRDQHAQILQLLTALIDKK